MSRQKQFALLLVVYALCISVSRGEINSSRPTLPEDQKPSEEKSDTTDKKNNSYLKALKEKWLIPMPKGEYDRLKNRFKGYSLFDAEDRPWTIPGVTLMTPTGYVAKWGDIYGAFSVNDRTRFGRIADAYAMLGFGFGDPAKWLGFELTLGFLNVRKLLNSGKGITIKAGHTFPDGTSIAIGKIDFLQWPANAADTGSSEYIAISRAFQLDYDPSQPFSLLIINLGLGDGQFKSDEKFRADIKGVGLFGSLSVRIAEPVNILANWNHNLHFGASIAPFRKIPFIITLAVMDTLKTQGDGLRYCAAISYADSIFSRSFPVDWFRGSNL